MKARPKMLREGRWIPAFAGMTPERGVDADLGPERRSPRASHCVIPAKAGIHDFQAFTQRRDENASNGNNP